MVLPGLFGLSLLALASALLQLVQTRMMTTPSDDPQQRSTQRVFLILPLISLIYGWFLPAGLFIYWITTTIFSIVQQFLINGFGGLFPLFGWTPGFASNHQPRFPVPQFTPRSESASTAARQDRRATRHVRQALDGRQRGWHHQAGQAHQPARETPMSDYQEFTGRTVEEAIRAAREALGRRRPRGPRLRDPDARAAGACWAWEPSPRASSRPPGPRWEERRPGRRPPQPSRCPRRRLVRRVMTARPTATVGRGTEVRVIRCRRLHRPSTRRRPHRPTRAPEASVRPSARRKVRRPSQPMGCERPRAASGAASRPSPRRPPRPDRGPRDRRRDDRRGSGLSQREVAEVASARATRVHRARGDPGRRGVPGGTRGRHRDRVPAGGAHGLPRQRRRRHR